MVHGWSTGTVPLAHTVRGDGSFGPHSIGMARGDVPLATFFWDGSCLHSALPVGWFLSPQHTSSEMVS